MLSFLAAVLPAFALLAVVDYRHYAARQEAAAEECRAVAQAAAATVQARVGAAAGAARLAALRRAAEGELAAALEEARRDHPEYLELFVLDAGGQVLAAAPAMRQPLVQPQAPAAQSAVLSDLFLTAPENLAALQVHVPLERGQGVASAVGVTLDAHLLLAGLPAPEDQASPFEIVLYDRRGQAIGSASPAGIPWEEHGASDYAHVKQALQGHAAAAASITSHGTGQAYSGAAVPLGQMGWALEVRRLSPEAAAYCRSRALLGLLPLAALTALALALAVGTGNWLTGAMRRLAAHASGLGRGQLNERITMRTGDELEDLGGVLNDMARQMEERDRRLRARTAELDAIITQSADGIAIHGPAGELQRLNPAAIRILGRSSSRLGLSPAEQAAWFKIHTAAGDPIDPSDLPVAAALRGETRVAQELRIETEAGQDRVVACSAAPLSDARGRIYGAVSIFRDMTQIHQAQQEKDNFVSVVSHELKTPITSIKGYAQMLLRRAEEAGSDERDLKGLRIINDEVERMVELINQLLDVSRLEMQRLQLNLDRVDLVALTLDAVDRLQMTTSRHTLQPRVPQGPLWVRADALRLVQVLGNLIMNAIKYSPEGGPVEVSLESQEGRAWISVRDWGIGIAAEDQPHLFQRFWRGTRGENTSLMGMGLGLYISREIIRRHHGDIVFRSQAGQGSTFLFWLPLDSERET